LWIGAVFADVVGKMLTTYCCIVRKFLGYGVLLLDHLVLLGFYPRR